eukprot:TRINITY_DN717_c0_g2_i1.p1 TRINITY_DN717_c0_g2~~TRINITY_DN717_c0_g2_i1.p1  ORF type:complete len:597 (+),score=214.63 TRINITY_DN717_c0_g2_i1:259-2049(+)
MQSDMYTVKWAFANEYDLVFTAVFLTVAGLTYVDDFLKKVKSAFIKAHGATLKEIVSKNARASVYTPDGYPFEKQFETILASFEDNETAIKTQGRQIRNYGEKKSKRDTPSKQGKTAVNQKQQESSDDGGDEDEDDDDDDDDDDGNASGNATPSSGGEMDEAARRAKLAKLRAKGKGRGGRASKGKSSGSGSNSPSVKATPGTPEKRVKKMTKWNDSVSKEEKKALDQSVAVSAAQEMEADLAFKKKFLPDASKKTDLDAYDESESEDEDLDLDDDDDDDDKGKSKSKASGFFRYFKRLTGTQEMEREDLEPVIKQLSELLMAKNVGTDIAEQFCESVLQNLVGKKLKTLQSVKSLVYEAMEKSLTNILTPKRSIDILRDIAQAKKEKRVYSIVFVGVNGVGKSTTLSKVCFWLQQNGVKVQIVACDTFRSGAVEQLRTHARCLNVDLFEKGYGKDASGIAADGIRDAAAKGYDCVLIDTAGRMQDNKNLMISLAKLVTVNSPDLILFVGEALVGNDAVDQVVKFNQSLADNSTLANPRLIDGIVLTKFDTIDDKVGAALSMVYTTGQPIVFVGVGQTYTDLKKLNVKQVTKALLK